MDRKPGSPDEPGAAGGREPPIGEQPDEDSERFGPLAVRSLRKDDGRSLLAFTRVEPPE